MTGLRRLDASSFRATAASLRRFAEPDLDEATQARLRDLFGRPLSADAAVAEIVADVRARGDAALRDWTLRLDGVDVADPLADPASLAAAWEATDPVLQAALRTAAERIRRFNELQRDALPESVGRPGLELRRQPLRRAGCYVPGGRAAYPSTVLMTTLPARVAGVGSIVVATPPGADGRAHPAVLAAAHLAGVDEVLAVGGAQAIAALAYGTARIAPVDVIVGPGNLFVTLAKRAVLGSVGIDGLAGPSEIVVVASAGVDAEQVAADLVSQLEHDPLAWAVLVTDEATIADDVDAAFEAALGEAQRRGITEQAAGRHGFGVVCADMEEALVIVDEVAPEHLELVGDAAEALCDRVRTAGAVFVGRHSPVPIGDYVAGPNHTLPTGGAARFGGPLSVLDFVRWPSITRLSADELDELGPAAQVIAEAEGLHAHTRSIGLRLRQATRR